MSSLIKIHTTQMANREALHRAQRDLFWLATEILDYTLMTEEFHKPICDWIVAHQGDTFNHFSAARGHYKTTIQSADLIRHVLRDPQKTHLALHAVDDEVQKLVQEVGNHFMKNNKLRKLLPDIMPAKQARRWLKSNNFTVKRGRFDRQPTLLGKSTGAEITGAHVTGSIRPDDIVGRNTIADSQLPNVKAWWRNTVMPVREPGCIVVASDTRWDIDDLAGQWNADPDWNNLTRAARETDGKPDYKGKSVLLAEKELRLRERQMGPSDWAMQMMNDPSPSGEKPWDRDQCEHFVSKEEVRGPGVFFVLSDPAPAKVGSYDGIGEKKRKDGTKDDWATCVVKVRTRGERQEIILIDGAASKEWDTDEGLDTICSFVQRYPGSRVYIEAYGGLAGDYEHQMRNAARRNGIRYRPVTFKGAYQAKAKNLRFARLADRARQDEFLICKSCPVDFLDRFLEQARNWRPLEGSRNSLKYDDCADVVSMATMKAIEEYSPRPGFQGGTQYPWLEKFRGPEPSPGPSWGTRHIKC
jgi:hypothetical protein